jgi:hypothetical protein
LIIHPDKHKEQDKIKYSELFTELGIWYDEWKTWENKYGSQNETTFKNLDQYKTLLMSAIKQIEELKEKFHGIATVFEEWEVEAGPNLKKYEKDMSDAKTQYNQIVNQITRDIESYKGLTDTLFKEGVQTMANVRNNLPEKDVNYWIIKAKKLDELITLRDHELTVLIVPISENDLLSDVIEKIRMATKQFEEVSKLFSKKYTECFTIVSEANNELAKDKQPFYVRVWDSVSGEKYARISDEILKKTGHKIGTNREMALAEYRKNALITTVGVMGLTTLVFYMYRKGRIYLQKRNLRNKLKNIKPELRWIIIHVKKNDDDDDGDDDKKNEMKTTKDKHQMNVQEKEIYTKVLHVIEDTLRPQNKLILKRVRPSGKKESLYGVQTYMTLDLLDSIQNILNVELLRKGLTTKQLTRLDTHSPKHQVNLWIKM